MTVSELRALLSGLPDGAKVGIQVGDSDVADLSDVVTIEAPQLGEETTVVVLRDSEETP